MINLNKIFPRLSIGNKLIIAFAGLSFLPLALLGTYTIFSSTHLMQTIALENLNNDVQIIRERSGSFLAAVESDLQFLRNSPPSRRLALLLKNSRRVTDRVTLRQVSDELLAFVETKHIYYHLRIVAENGDELLRVQAQYLASDRPSYRVIWPSDRYHPPELWHFFLVENLAEGQVGFAPAEIVHEQTKEFVPVISFVTPFIHDNQRVGILIANVFARNFFQALEARRQRAAAGTVALVNAEGHYIYHSEKKNHWNKLLAFRDEDNLYHSYPSAVAEAILAGEDGTVTEGIDEIISYGSLFPPLGLLQAREPFTGPAVPLVVFKSASKEAIIGPVHSYAWILGGSLILFLAAAVGLALLATKQFSKPIVELIRGAEVISKGSYNQRLRIETNDEIEQLAHAFNRMAESLDAHEREIQKHRTMLEEIVKQRTGELTDEKNKLQAIIDHVPSALLLLDRNLCIQSVSAAYSVMTQNSIGEVRGKLCNLCSEFGVPYEHCPSRKALVSGLIESHVVHRGKENASFEHVAVPIKRDGQVEAILEIITDITERKRLQDQLLRAEKATAVGEMAAVIAHEMRNSLTSVKLILQYFFESHLLRRAKEKESMKVAMSSMHRMESIVNELLNFSKPRQMNPAVRDINQLVKESIIFSRHQFERKRIALIEELSPHPLRLKVDSESFKEVLLNLLLNATQATRERIGVIKVRTSLSELTDTLRDSFSDFRHLPQPVLSSLPLYSHHINFIEMRRGTKVVTLEVADNGCGIAAEHLPRIFDPFFTTKTEGTGLGLTMAKRVVNEHGGVIVVESPEGKGSLFKIVLPFVEEESWTRTKF